LSSFWLDYPVENTDVELKQTVQIEFSGPAVLYKFEVSRAMRWEAAKSLLDSGDAEMYNKKNEYMLVVNRNGGLIETYTPRNRVPVSN